MIRTGLLFATGALALSLCAQSTAAANRKPENPKRVQLRADAARLAKASAELKAMLAHTNPDTMSLEVVKKAQEVEELAKLVQKEMKQQ